eukprot:CAMPEP_0185831014 /NCGR_PEP_ID=MMETSP1353-20130828/1227_1 /TAXON_ID=1077150 /ORGANISM="Erythrolobus australicus, Strain CCMP3124" /LENGTH=602 /DNA_ID=CAMNT_0028529025 /DNA_START=223 /DNA_END=2032 /DNA_ORIENTATION=+
MGDGGGGARVHVRASVDERVKYYGKRHNTVITTDSNEREWVRAPPTDQILHEVFFPNSMKGTFLEIGAGDGVQDSNTKFFQDSMQWKGLLVEPSKKSFTKLITNRKQAKRERAAICSNRAAGSQKFVEAGTNAHLVEFGDEEQDKNKETYSVPCITMDRLMRKHEIASLDLLAIDARGAERIVLNDLDMDITPVRVIMFENSRSCVAGPRKTNACNALLKSKGFCFAGESSVNSYWVSDKALKKLCDVPFTTKSLLERFSTEAPEGSLEAAGDAVADSAPPTPQTPVAIETVTVRREDSDSVGTSSEDAKAEGDELRSSAETPEASPVAATDEPAVISDSSAGAEFTELPEGSAEARNSVERAILSGVESVSRTVSMLEQPEQVQETLSELSSRFKSVVRLTGVVSERRVPVVAAAIIAMVLAVVAGVFLWLSNYISKQAAWLVVGGCNVLNASLLWVLFVHELRVESNPLALLHRDNWLLLFSLHAVLVLIQVPSMFINLVRVVEACDASADRLLFSMGLGYVYLYALSVMLYARYAVVPCTFGEGTCVLPTSLTAGMLAAQCLMLAVLLFLRLRVQALSAYKQLDEKPFVDLEAGAASAV